MNIKLIYNALFCITLSFGLYFFYNGFLKSKKIFGIRYRAGPLYQYKLVKDILLDSHQDEVFAEAGISKMNLKKYLLLRKLTLTAFCFMGVFKFTSGNIDFAKLNIIFGLLIFYITSPKKSFFKYALEILKKKRKNKIDEELTGVILQLENLILSCEKVSLDYIITRTLPFTKLSQTAFSEFLKNIRRGENKRAKEQFTVQTGTKLGELLANILSLMDELPQREFLSQLDILKQRAEAEHRTRIAEKDASLNTLRYGVAMLQILLIVADFLYLICMDSVKMLLLL